ncbi:hypothetical protein WUBG_04652 [Wuchereria bancrofti]|uniref:Uncharacterized protein n=1 Tax=Wuchereria bancrofti TaxID=6293 RepID=J9FAQ3_WUCBA|nr:hypothetical protein WUBG_04652 [Wuchereria bancrofti]
MPELHDKRTCTLILKTRYGKAPALIKRMTKEFDITSNNTI